MERKLTYKSTGQKNERFASLLMADLLNENETNPRASNVIMSQWMKNGDWNGKSLTVKEGGQSNSHKTSIKILLIEIRISGKSLEKKKWTKPK